MEASDPEDTPRRSQAVSLHQSISADRWCVTRRDLHYLKGQAGGSFEVPAPTDQMDIAIPGVWLEILLKALKWNRS